MIAGIMFRDHRTPAIILHSRAASAAGADYQQRILLHASNRPSACRLSSILLSGSAHHPDEFAKGGSFFGSSLNDNLEL
jgi:hypothetical protein